MKNQSLKLNDLVLVTGHAHYEKAKVIKVDSKTGIVTLDNQMQITQDYMNVSKTQMKAEPWDEEKFEYLHASQLFNMNLNTLMRQKDQLPSDALVSINHKLEKWISKYNLKRI